LGIVAEAGKSILGNSYAATDLLTTSQYGPFAGVGLVIFILLFWRFF
jgi:hypothetical protein